MGPDQGGGRVERESESGPDQGGEWRMDGMVLVKILPRCMLGVCLIYGTHTCTIHKHITCDAEREMDIQLTIESCVSISFFSHAYMTATVCAHIFLLNNFSNLTVDYFQASGEQ